jgi:hypothetical protein
LGILFDTWDKIFGDMEEYFAMCSWMKEIYEWKMKMDDFFNEHYQHTIFFENLNNRNRVEQIYVGLFWNFWHMKCSNHTSYFFNMKYI